MKSIRWAILVFLSTIIVSVDSVAQNQPVKEWTVLVFLNADNDLYRFAVLNMAQMESVGSNEQLNIVVQFDPEPRNLPTNRYYVTKQQNPINGKIASPVVESLGESDMGSSKTLSEFLIWGVRKYPAKKYAVIIWNHGNGWQGISYDDNPKTHLSIPDVRTSLESVKQVIASQRGTRNQGPLVDIINFDACLMSTLEVAHELKDVAQVLVGSQFNEPGAGENYATFLSPIAAKPSLGARELSEIMVYQYTLNYKDKREINYAAVDLAKVASFTSQFNSTIALAQNSSGKDAIRRSFGMGSFDLVTGLNNARKESGSHESGVASAFDNLISTYGYPAEGISRRVNPRESSLFTVTRNHPSIVNFRNRSNEPWKSANLISKNGVFSYEFQKRPAQYYVMSSQQLRNGRSLNSRESMSTVIRDDSNPIIFHNQFPENSPLIADSYSMLTQGAHGMTLYSLAGWMSSQNPSTANFGRAMLQEYRNLMFARSGAPQWTLFFGL